MVIYEIHAKVSAGLVSKFVNYMNNRHIPQILDTGYFESADLKEVGRGEYVISYLCRSRETLEIYFDKSAEALREDFAAYLPSGVKIVRKIIDT